MLKFFDFRIRKIQIDFPIKNNIKIIAFISISENYLALFEKLNLELNKYFL